MFEPKPSFLNKRNAINNYRVSLETPSPGGCRLLHMRDLGY